jgi:hypothetical protein
VKVVRRFRGQFDGVEFMETVVVCCGKSIAEVKAFGDADLIRDEQALLQKSALEGSCHRLQAQLFGIRKYDTSPNLLIAGVPIQIVESDIIHVSEPLRREEYVLIVVTKEVCARQEATG